MIYENRINTTLIQHIRNLFESIKDGKLTITYYDPIEPSYDRTYDVSCIASDVEEFILKYESFIQALEAIAKVHYKIDNGANIEDVLTPEQIKVWNTYIRDFDEEFDAGEYNLDELYAMRESGAELNEAEYDVLERHHEWFEAQVLKRLPKKEYAPILFFNRAQRYECLISLKAPEIFVNKEARCLAEEMILYYFGK